MDNLFQAYMCLGASSAIMAYFLVLRPSIAKAKVQGTGMAFIYTFLFLLGIFFIYPLCIWSILSQTEETKKYTYESITNVKNSM